jgi:hypothetical protein
MNRDTYKEVTAITRGNIRRSALQASDELDETNRVPQAINTSPDRLVFF